MIKSFWKKFGDNQFWILSRKKNLSYYSGLNSERINFVLDFDSLLAFLVVFAVLILEFCCFDDFTCDFCENFGCTIDDFWLWIVWLSRTLSNASWETKTSSPAALLKKLWLKFNVNESLNASSRFSLSSPSQMGLWIDISINNRGRA